MNHDNNNVRERVMDAIKKGGVAMRPRWHFMAKAALALTGGIIIFLTLLYVAGFTIFSLRETGAWFGPAFGGRGWMELLISLPWLLIFLAIIFIGILEVLVRKYSFVYRKPLLYSVLAILALVLLGGYAVSRSTIREGWRRNIQARPPMPGAMHGPFGPRFPRNIHRGTVIEVLPQVLVIKDPRGATTTVIIGSSTASHASFAPGDEIVIFGPRIGAVIRAVGIRSAPLMK